MATKLFKPGEWAFYGKCRITVKGDEIKVDWMDWNKDKVELSRTFNAKTSGNDLPIHLEEQSTHYWSDTMMDWVKSKCDYKIPSLFGGAW